MFTFHCKCNRHSFEIGSFSEKNAFIFTEEIKDQDLDNEMAEKMLIKLDGQKLDYFIAKETELIKEILISQTRRFIECPSCGRVHVFWTKNDKIVRITYSPELKYAYGKDFHPIKIQIPYNKQIRGV